MHGLLTAPGVYLQGSETPPLPLSSAITGFVGIAERGPLNSPQPLDGWSDYADTFGYFVPFGYLAESVFGFFRNGGERCWVVRAADTSRIGLVTPAGECVRDEPLATAARVYTDHNGDNTLRIAALDPGEWGNRMRVRISTSTQRPLRIGVLTAPTTVLSAQIFIDSIVDLRPGAMIRITNADGTSAPTDIAIGGAPGALNLGLGRVDLAAAVGRVYDTGSVVQAAGFRIEAEFRDRREIFDRLSLRQDHARYFATVINGSEPIADYGERRRRGLSSLIRVEQQFGVGGVSRFRPADSPSVETLTGGADGFTQARATFRDAALAPLVRIVATTQRGSAANGLRLVAVPFRARTAVPIPDVSGARDRIVVDEIEGFLPAQQVGVGEAVAPTFETATPATVDTATNLLQLPADLANAHAVGEPVSVTGRFTLEVRRAGEREPIEVIRNLSGNVAAGARFIRTALQTDSALLCADAPAAAFATPIIPPAVEAVIELAGGSDPGAIDARYYTGYQVNGTHFHPPELPPETLVGLATLELVEEISLVAAPDLVRVAPASLIPAQTNVLRHCARLGDRFALIDAPEVISVAPRDGAPAVPSFSIEDWVAALGDARLRRFGAAFHPWVQGRFEDVDRVTPPTGLIAGLIARSDALRGVNKAPANEQLKGAFALVPPIDRQRHGELNPLSVNCIVKLEDGEVRLMGARTLSDDIVARYINIRRTILSVRKTLAQRMLWTVFEPIGDALFQRIESTLNTYLQGLLAKGVTASQRPADAYFVRCNGENNPDDQLRNGIVLAEIGIALLAPAEFIVLTARRTPDALQVIEEEA